MRTPGNAELFATYLAWQDHERGRSDMTVLKYGYTLRQFDAALDGKSVLTMDVNDLRSFVLAPVARATRRSELGDEPSPATRKRKVAELRSFFRWLHGEGFRFDDPSARLVAPPVHNENPRPVPLEMWERVWRSPLLDDSERVAFGLGFFCGLRRSEIVSVGAHQFEGGKLLGFRRKGGKRSNLPWQSCVQMCTQRMPHLGADSFETALQRLLRERKDNVFLIPWGSGAEAYMVNKRLSRALLTVGLDRYAFSPHQLRHSFGTNMLDMGVPILSVSRLMGHSSVTVTQRYLATAEDPLAELLEA